MGTLRNFSALADQMEHAVKTVQTHRDIDTHMGYLFSRMENLGPKTKDDVLWNQLIAIIRSTLKEDATYAPDEYVPWLENMTRLWFAVCSTREMLITWGKIDPACKACNLTPADAVIGKDAEATDFCDAQVQSRLDEISGDTTMRLTEAGITTIPYVPSRRWKARALAVPHGGDSRVYYASADRRLPVGFLRIKEEPANVPQFNTPRARVVGDHELKVPVVWARQMYPVEFGIFDDEDRDVMKEEVAIRIAMDLLAKATDFNGILTLNRNP